MGKISTLLKNKIRYDRFTLLGGLLLLGFTGFSQSGKTNARYPESGSFKLENSPNSIEDISRRDEFSRTFKNPDGSFTRQQAFNPLHYKDENGKWATIQTIPERSKSNPGVVEMTRSDLPLSVNTQNGISKMFLKKDKMISFGSNAKVLWINQDNSVSKTISQSQSIFSHDFNDNIVTLKNVFPGIDRKQVLDYDHLRTDYIINQQPSLSAAVEYVVFEDYISLPANWKIDYASGEMTDAGWKGDLSITNEQHVLVGNFSLPVFYDAFQSNGKSLLSKHITKGTYKIAKSGEGYKIQILVPAKWLNAPERVYPVTVDPTVSGTKAQYGSVKGYAYDGACQETLAINVPAGTITNTSSTYSITAQNGGWCSEQVSRVGSGASWSGNQTNTTNSAGTFSYNIASMSIVNGTWCGGNITFTWQAYRTWDADGFDDCDQYNQYRSGNWVVNVDYTAIVAGAPASVGWTTASAGAGAAPTCGNWSGTWCSGSGTYTDLTLVQGVNYTVENTGDASCGAALSTAYLQAWWSGGSTACGYGSIDSPGTNSISFNAVISGGHRIGVTSNTCGAANTCGGGLGIDFSTSSAVLRYRQNTTVSNTTSASDLCLSATRTLSATLGGGHNNPTIDWTVVSGGGSIAGTTYTPSSAGSVTIRATVGNCTSDVTFNVIDPGASSVGISGTTTICNGSSTVLTASGGVTYSWSPATGLSATTGTSVTANPTSTQVYSVTETSGVCIGTGAVTVTVNGTVTPTFNAVAAICSGGTLSALPTTSTNGITGTWSPALDNTTTTTYTFTPNAGQCATTTTLMITVNPNVAPTFNAVAAICSGGTLSALPTTSTNGITGTWSPALDNTATTTYTFTPDAGQCSSTTTLMITVNPNVTPTFSAVGPICAGDALSALPTTSTNGITGTWSPALDNTTTTIYTFTPDAGQCATTTTMTITVNALPTAAIMAGSATTICPGETVTLTGSGGGTYGWSPATGLSATMGSVVNASPTTTQTYTLTVTTGSCTDTETITITVNPLVVSVVSDVPSVCAGESATLTASGAVTYTWAPATGLNQTTGDEVIATPTATQTYTVTGTDGACSGSQNITITVKTNPTVSVSPSSANLCAGNSITLTGAGASSYVWLPTLSSGVTVTVSPMSTITYTALGTAANGCVGQGTATVTVTTPPSATISYAGLPYCTSISAAQPVSQTGTTGGTYTAGAGLSINAATGAITPSTSSANTYTVTYTIPASGGCSMYTTTTSVTINAVPTATINYPGSPFCGSLAIAQNVSQTGEAGGTYSSTAGLTIDPSTGAITPSTSTPGAYTVTYTIAAGSGCPAVTATASVTITAPPAATISYAGTPFCTSISAAQPVSHTGTTGGTYTSTAGLSINAATGAITPSTSSAGTYTVTYTVAAASGCPMYTTTTIIDINAVPTATITYPGSPFCGNLSSAQNVSQTGSAGGTYSSTAGLVINAATGAITPSTSTAGTYTVTYTIAAASGCPAVTATTSVTITTPPSATISYGTPFCTSVSAAQPVTHTGTTGGTYSSTAGLTLNAATGAITPSTSSGGTYTVTYTVAAAGGCPIYTTTTSVTINVVPTASITYPGTPFCGNLSAAQNVSLTGTAGGTYTSTAGLMINSATGAITPSLSTAGTYTVTYTIAAAGGCPAVTATTSVTITTAPSATISYTGSPFCSSISSAQPVSLTGTAGGSYSSTAGLSINATTGAITPSTSTAGIYTVTYTIAAAGGCPIFTTTTTAEVHTVPVATITYSGSPFCGNLAAAQSVTQTGTSGGTYTSTAGLSINAATGAITPSTSTAGTYTVTYTIAAASGCPAVTATASVTITTAPAATISYASPFCISTAGAQAVTHTGTTGGTYTSTAGLTINAATGAVTPSTSTAGTYTVTYTIAAAGGCPIYTTTASVTINPVPAATISYASPFCGNVAAAQSVTQTGTTGGTYTSTAGLTIDATTGAITPSTSTAGTYTVTYTIAASGGCSAMTTTASVTINPAPAATISYASPFCMSTTSPQSVTRTGTAGGSYSSTAGLSINAATGAITPSTSTAGTYTVTYTIAAAGGCPIYTTTASVTINPIPIATISYSGSPFCGNLSAAQSVTQTGTAGGTYTSTAGLTIDATTGAITPSTSTAGTYTVTYTIAAGSGCPAVTATASVTITTPPTATISYAGSPFCNSVSAAQSVTQTGTTGGIYSSTPGLTIGAVNGAITPSSSVTGTYMVTYSIAAANGCPVTTATTTVTVNPIPAATISYTGSPFCGNLGAQSVTQTGTAGGTYTSAAGLTINASTGAITPSSSTAGTYTVTYTIAAGSGCPAVTATASVTITAPPAATITYAGSPFCSSTTGAQAVTHTGTTGGTYTSTAGLTINASTGAVTPSTSTTGPYTVTYTMAAANGCPAMTATASVTVNPIPAATISYTGSPFCGNLGAQSVAQTGTAGGTYTSAAGLTINASTGAITPSSSTAGTYTVTYTIAAGSGCPAVTATTSVTITAPPAATITYAGSPFCSSVSGAQAVTHTGTTGGTYTSTAGLSINVSTGAVTPSTSTAGTYTVTYTMAAANGCPVTTATASVTVTTAPTATISYAGSPYCASVTGGQAVTQTGTSGGTYSASPAGLSINTSTGAVSPDLSTPGTYTVTYTVAAAGGCAALNVTTSVTINAIPSATIAYSAAQFCSSIPSAQPVTLTGTTGGTFSSTTGLSISASTGAITPNLSTPGIYTVTYDVTPAGCSSVTTTATVEIVLSPTANITYAGPYCASVPTAQPVTLNGTGNYTGGTYSASPAGLNINATTGEIIPNLSTAGTYLVTYTVPASSGCSSGTATVNVTITATPSAVISYTSPFCSTVTGAQAVTFTGSTGGTFSSTAGLTIDATTGAITPSTSTGGTYVVTYTTLPSGSCPPGTATSTVQILATPVVNDLADQTLCDLTYTLPVITGTSLTGNEMYFTAPNGGGSSFVAGDVISSTTQLYIYDANGSCSDEESVLITINQSPVITNPGDQTACGTYTLPLIAGTNLSGSEAYYNNSQVLGGTVITGSITSTQTVWIYDANGTCSDEESFNITINVVPDASFTASNYCGGTGAAPVITGATGGTFSFNPAVTDGATIDPTTGVITAGITGTTYTIEYAISGACPVSTQEQVTFNAVPASPATGNDTTYCSSETFAGITATAGAGGTLNWYNDAALTNQVGTGTSVVPANVTGTTTYYVTETVSGCPSLASTVDVTVNASPAAPAASSDITYCKGDTIADISATGIAGNTLTWYEDAALTIPYGTGGSVTPQNVLGANTYYVTQTGSGCESVSASVTVTINDCFELEVTTAFTPGDGDNVNNTWEIPELNLRYPNCNVTIFNRWGQILFNSDGYATPWDGKYNGEDLPVGSYYYIIEFNDAENTPNATGTVTIIRN